MSTAEPAAAPAVDTDDLREIAAAANPGPWVRNGRRVLWPHGTMKVSLTTADGEIGRFDAEHIATFDPPTVLALLDELDTHRATHAELVALKRLCERQIGTMDHSLPGNDHEASVYRWVIAELARIIGGAA